MNPRRWALVALAVFTTVALAAVVGSVQAEPRMVLIEEVTNTS